MNTIALSTQNDTAGQEQVSELLTAASALISGFALLLAVAVIF
jgi:hypothetical protein